MTTHGFLPSLTAGVRGEHLPCLHQLLASMEAEAQRRIELNEDYEDTLGGFFLRFIDFYGKVVLVASRVFNEETDENIPDVFPGKELYSRFLRELRLQKLYPGFDELWKEAVLSFRNTDSFKLHGRTTDLDGFYRVGVQMTFAHLCALEYAYYCDKLYGSRYTWLWRTALRYPFRQSNYEVYLQHRDMNHDPLFELTEVLAQFKGREFETNTIISFFCDALAYTVAVFSAGNYTPSIAMGLATLGLADKHWRLRVEKLISNDSTEARQALVNVNIRGATEVFVQRSRELVQQYPPAQLSWHLHVWFFQCTMKAYIDAEMDVLKAWGLGHLQPRLGFAHPNIPPSLKERMAIDHFEQGTNWLRIMIRRAKYIDSRLIEDSAMPIDDFTMPGREEILISPASVQALQALHGPPDVVLEPVGEELKALDYSDVVEITDTNEVCVICQDKFEDETVVKTRTCGHVFHQDCLTGMINGVERISNLCPLDRTEICPPRPRRPVNDQAAASQNLD